MRTNLKADFAKVQKEMDLKYNSLSFWNRGLIEDAIPDFDKVPANIGPDVMERLQNRKVKNYFAIALGIEPFTDDEHEEFERIELDEAIDASLKGLPSTEPKKGGLFPL